MKKEFVGAIAGLVVIVLAVAAFVYYSWDEPSDNTASVNEGAVATTSENAAPGQGIAVGEPNPSAPTESGFEMRLASLKKPSLTEEVEYGSTLNAAQRASIGEKILLQRAVVANGLTGVSEVFNGWNNLALFYTFAKDFKKAQAVWEYLSKVFPTDPTALNYLGNMYRNDTHDFPASESAYRGSLKIDPAQPSVYAELFYLYSAQYKVGTDAAEQILLEALKQFPNDPAFTKALNDYRAKMSSSQTK